MLRWILALVLCGACDGSTVDPHELGTCDETWIRNGYDQCEAACVASGPALTASGPACTATTSNGSVSCQKTFVFAGATGCCATSPGHVLFGECD